MEKISERQVVAESTPPDSNRHARDGFARMDAEAAAADEVVGEAEVAEQFGEAGDEADDAGFALGGGVRGVEGVAEFAGWRHGGF